MRLFTTIFFFCFTLTNIKAQQFDKKNLDEKVKQINSVYQFREPLYIINGIPYDNSDSLKIDSVLLSNGLKYLLSIDILKESATVNLISCRPIRDVVLVTFVHRQYGKQKRKVIKRVKQAFVDNYISFSQNIFIDSKDPVLFINNKPVHHTEAKQKIKSLTLNSVYYIVYNDKPASTEIYGQNAKNGLVRIWTIKE